MDKPQIISQDGKPAFAVVPWAEYQLSKKPTQAEIDTNDSAAVADALARVAGVLGTLQLSLCPNVVLRFQPLAYRPTPCIRRDRRRQSAPNPPRRARNCLHNVRRCWRSREVPGS